MLDSLRVWTLLRGERGHPPVDLERLLELLIRFSYLVADHAEIARIDAKPLQAGPHAAVVGRGAVELEAKLVRSPSARFSHLSMRPYPEEYTTTAELPDGRGVTLRPIKPEDEPLWHEMIAACSRDSVRMRFRGLLNASTHELATRFCFIDYNREIAIVAELEQDGQPRMVGIATLVADPDRRRAEFAILIADPWQQLGLAHRSPTTASRLPRAGASSRLIATTTPNNQRVLSLLKLHGFELRRQEAAEVVAERRLRPATARA